MNVVGAWVDPPGHDFFFVLETDDYDALVEGLRPIIPSGTATIQPVGDMGATVAKRIAEESLTSTNWEIPHVHVQPPPSGEAGALC